MKTKYQLAYQAAIFQIGGRPGSSGLAKRVYNPIFHLATGNLTKVVRHLDEQQMPFVTALRRARTMILEGEAHAYLMGLKTREELLDFLQLVRVFVLALNPTRGRRGLVFTPTAGLHLNDEGAIQQAYQAQRWRFEPDHQYFAAQMGAIAGEDKYEYLYRICQFLLIPHRPGGQLRQAWITWELAYVLVEKLGQLDVPSFRKFLNAYVIFQNASRYRSC